MGFVDEQPGRKGDGTGTDGRHGRSQAQGGACEARVDRQHPAVGRGHCQSVAESHAYARAEEREWVSNPQHRERHGHQQASAGQQPPATMNRMGCHRCPQRASVKLPTMKPAGTSPM